MNQRRDERAAFDALAGAVDIGERKCGHVG
jgi:hypothetical protein